MRCYSLVNAAKNTIYKNLLFPSLLFSHFSVLSKISSRKQTQPLLHSCKPHATGVQCVWTCWMQCAPCSGTLEVHDLSFTCVHFRLITLIRLLVIRCLLFVPARRAGIREPILHAYTRTKPAWTVLLHVVRAVPLLVYILCRVNSVTSPSLCVISFMSIFLRTNYFLCTLTKKQRQKDKCGTYQQTCHIVLKNPPPFFSGSMLVMWYCIRN